MCANPVIPVPLTAVIEVPVLGKMPNRGATTLLENNFR